MPIWVGRVLHRVTAAAVACVTPLTLVAFLTNVTLAQQIVVEGRTQTSLAVRDRVTDVTTGTVSGQNAFNSFNRFNVDAGNTVNLHLPDGTRNLLNVVRSEKSEIDGVLNSIKDGEVGGNVYFANPQGFVVGKDGAVNVGALTVSTTTQEFADRLIDKHGTPDDAAAADLVAGTAPLNPDGLIAVDGSINATGDVHLAGGQVRNRGSIQSGAVFRSGHDTSGSSRGPDFSDVVNVNGYASGTSIAVENGDIVIHAEGDFENTGVIATDGATGLDAGNVVVTAGRDLHLKEDGVVSARGRGTDSDGGRVYLYAGHDAERGDAAMIDARGGTSGDGGKIELSGKDHVVLSGGSFRAAATNGRAGKVLVDPDEIEISADDHSDGADISYSADSKITVDDGVTLSSRNLADPDGGNHLTDSSQGDSGSITLAAPTIIVGDNANLLAQADNGYNAGNISLLATDSANATWSVGALAFRDIETNASITVGAATIKGKNVDIEAIASTSKLADLESEVSDDEGSGLGYDVNEDSIFNLDLFAAAVTAKSTATISIDTGANLHADEDLTLRAEASSTAQTTTLSTYAGVTYGFTKPTASIDVASGASLSAVGDIDISSTANGTLNTLLLVPSFGDSQGTVVVGYGKARVEADVDIDDGAIISGDNISIASDTANLMSTAAYGLGFNAGSKGAAVAVVVGDYKSNASTTVAGDVTAGGDLAITATSHNLNNDTRSGSTVISSLKDSVGSLVSGIQSVFSSKAGSFNPSSNASIALGAAVTVVDSSNRADAIIADGADVAAAGDLTLAANAEDNFQASASGTAGSAQTAVGGAVVVADYDNRAYAHIDGGASVDSGQTLTVDAFAEIPNQVTFLDFGKEYPDDEEGAFEDPMAFIKALSPYLIGATGTLAVDTKVATSYVHSEASSNANDGELNVSLMVNVLSVDNSADAYIADGAQVNQDATYTSADQSVDVSARGSVETINVGAMASVLNIASGGGGTYGAANGVGGLYNQVTYTNHVTAYIDDGATVSAANDIVVDANAHNYLVDVGQAGDRSSGSGVTGSFGVADIDTSAIAYIDDEAVVSAGGDISVAADNEVIAYNVNGGVALGADAGVGLSVSYTEVHNDTLAFIGNADDTIDTTAAGSVTAAGDITINADSEYEIYSIGVAGAAPVGTGSTTEKKYGVGVSGDAAVNNIDDDTETAINDMTVTADGAIALSADTDSIITAGGGAVAFNDHAGIGGSYSHNIIDRTTKATTANADIQGSSVSLDASSHDRLLAVAVGGSGAKQGTAVAGSVTINEVGSSGDQNLTQAGFGSGTSVTSTSGDVSAHSDDELDLIGIAGTASVSKGGSAGVGVALDFAFINTDVDSFVSPSVHVNSATDLIIKAVSEQDTINVVTALAGATDGFAGEGSATTQDTDSDIEAEIGDSAVIDADGNVAVVAESNTDVHSIAGGFAAGKTVGVGASISTVIRDEDVLAHIDTNADVTARANHGTTSVPTKDEGDSQDISGVAVTAVSHEDVVNVAAGGSVSGEAAIYGSAAPIKLTETTQAYIGDGATVSDTGANDAQSVTVLAADDTFMVGVAGAALYGAEGGIGGGVETGSLNKTTEAYIDSNAAIDARDNVTVRAYGEEDLTFATAVLSAGGEVAGTVAAAGYGIYNTTRAYVGSDADVAAAGNVLVTADDDNEVDLGTGGGAFAGDLGLGASIGVLIVDKTTEAYIASGANVTALATRDAISAPTGTFGVSYDTESTDEGEVSSPSLNNSDLDAAALSSQREASKGEALFKGVAVVATNRDDLETVAVAGSGAGTGAVSVASNTTSLTSDTYAYVDGANINQDNTGAGSEQSVLVAAGSDLYRLGVAGAAAIAGTAGVGPGVDVLISNADTKAYIGASSTVAAMADIAVVADATEDFYSIGAGIAGGGTIGVAGAAATISHTGNTYADIQSDTDVGADGNVLVRADDDSDAAAGSGAGALGIGGGGVGGSVGVIILDKDTKARIGANAAVAAAGNSANTLNAFDGSGPSNGEYGTTTTRGIAVQASSSEDVTNVAVSGAGGFYAGVAGSVSVDSIDSDTEAQIGVGATINADNSAADSEQGVYVAAVNAVNILDVGGAIGGAVGAGIAGSVDVASVRNATSAGIDSGAEVNVAHDVSVLALSDLDADTIVVSGSAGAVAIAGAVGVYTFGNALSDDAKDRLTTDGADYDSVQSYTDSQLQDDTAATILSETGNSDLTQTSTDLTDIKTGLAVSDDIESTSVSAGTVAYIGDGATIHAGNDVTVRADSVSELDALTGAAAIGLIGAGAGIGVANTHGGARAYIGEGSSVDLSGDLSLVATLDNDDDIDAYAGSLGLGALEAAVAIIEDDSDSEASIGADSSVTNGTSLTVQTSDTRTQYAQAWGTAIGVVAAGASVAKTKAAGSAIAAIGDGVVATNISGDLVVESDSVTHVDSQAEGSAGGIGSGVGNEGFATINLDTTASIGDDADLSIAGDVTVLADSRMLANSRVDGTSIGGISVGVSDTESNLTAGVSATVGSGSRLDADGDIDIAARHNVDENGDWVTDSGAYAVSISSVGALLGGTGSEATVDETIDVVASVGDSANLSGNDITIQSLSSPWGESTGKGNAYGVLAAGATNTDTTITHNNHAAIGDDAELNANGDVTLSAASDIYAKADSHGGSGGIVAGSSTDASATATDHTWASIGDGSVVSATGTLLAQALSALGVHSKGDIDSGGAVTFNLTTAESTATTTTEVQIGGATLSADDVELHARVTKVDVDATSRSKTYAADSTTNAESTITGTIQASVSIAAGADITGTSSIDVLADQDGVDTLSDATAEIGAGLTGVVEATANNTLDLDSTITTDDGSALRTATLTIKTDSPTAQVWGRDATANAQTVVNYIVETIEVVQKVTSWIPFVGSVVKWVTKKVTRVIEEVLHSDTSAVLGGSFSSNSDITLNGDIYLTALDPTLVVAADGSIAQQQNVVATIGNGVVEVGDLAAGDESSADIDAGSGTVSGDAVFHLSSFGAVTLINHSDNDLRINDVTVTSIDTSVPDISVTAGTDSSTFSAVTDDTTSDVLVENTSSSDVIFAGLVTNPFGSIDVTNTGGDVLGESGHTLQAHTVDIAAANGGIGTGMQALSLELADGTDHARLATLSNGDTHLDVRAVSYRDVGAANATASITGIDLDDIIVGGDLELNLRQGQALLQTDTGITRQNVAATYGANSAVTASGDVDLDIDNGATLNLTGMLTSGLKDVVVAIDASGAIASGIDYTSSSDGGSVAVEDIEQKGGHVAINGALSGNGTIKVLDGYSHVAIINASNQNLQVGDIDLSTQVTGQVTINGVNRTLPGSYNSITLAKQGYASGQVDVANQGTGDVILTGHLNNPSGNTNIANALGDIQRDGAAQRITAHDLTLTATAGQVGPDSLAVDLTGGSLNGGAAGDFAVSEIDGDLNLGSIVSLNGEVRLSADQSIVDAANDAAADVTAKSIVLTAAHGSIGSLGNRLEINSSTPQVGGLTASAHGDVVVTETEGDLLAHQVQSETGNVDLVSTHGHIGAGAITAAATARLNSWGNIFDLDHDAGDDVSGRDIELLAPGTIGAAADALDIDSSTTGSGHLTAAAGFGAFLNETTGNLNVATVDTKVGDVDLSAASGDIVLGTVNALSGAAGLHAAHNIVDAHAGGADITANNITLTTDDGDVGASDAIEINSRATSAGVVRAQVAGTIRFEEVSDDVVADGIEAGGAIVIVADRSILSGATNAVDVRGDAITLTASHGSIGKGDAALHLAASGDVSLTAASTIDVDAVEGSLLLANASASERVNLRVEHGDLVASHIESPEVTLVVAEGDADVAQLLAEKLDAEVSSDGRQVHVGFLALGGRRPQATILADRTVVDDMEETKRQVTFDLRGNDGGIADAIELRGDLRKAQFVDLQAGTMTIDVGASRHQSLKIKNLVLIDTGDIRTNSLDVHIGAGDATPFRLFVGSTRARTKPTNLPRVFTVTPRSAGSRVAASAGDGTNETEETL